MNNSSENGIEKDNQNFDTEENMQEKTEDVSPAETAELSENDLAAESVEEEVVTKEAIKVPTDETVETRAVKTAAASRQTEGMGTATKFLVLIGVLIALGAGLVFWKSKAGESHAAVEHISKEEIEMILQDVNPMMLRQIASNPGAKKELADNVRELFAIANQAKKEGLAADIDVKRELENIDLEILATGYDKAMNKDKGPMPPFGFISEERMNQFWAGADYQPGFWDKIGFGSNPAEAREKEFEKFLDAKIKMFKENSPEGKAPEITEEQRKQAREYFAKTRIYAAEAESKKGAADSGLPADFFQKVELQSKLQKAQFLARLYSQKVLAKKLEVTDEEVQKYIEEHPELGSKEEKRTKAEEILNRAKAGEDFAKLASEYSEDPGSKDKGGLYEDITEGAFVPEFEKAVFSLEKGQIYPELVESSFGYHIIKAEDFGENAGTDGQKKRTFDARHILISTMFKDPENPMGRDMPVKDYVEQKLQKEKQEKVLEEIKKNNPVEVAENFEVTVPPMPEQPEFPGMMPGMEDEPGAEVDAPKKDAPKSKETKPAAPKKK